MENDEDGENDFQMEIWSSNITVDMVENEFGCYVIYNMGNPIGSMKKDRHKTCRISWQFAEHSDYCFETSGRNMKQAYDKLNIFFRKRNLPIVAYTHA